MNFEIFARQIASKAVLGAVLQQSASPKLKTYWDCKWSEMNVIHQFGCSNLTNKAKVIHESNWAVTILDNCNVYKLFKYNDMEKIVQEVELLRKNTFKSVSLLKDPRTQIIYSVVPYTELFEISQLNCDAIVKQLDLIFSKWSEYSCESVDDIWKSRYTPYALALLKTYFPNEHKYADILKSLDVSHFVHGDFTTANVKSDFHGRVFVLDFENSCFGPLFWDEATLVLSLLDENEFDLGKWLYMALNCPYHILEVNAAVRLAKGYKNSANIVERKKTFAFVKAEMRKI